MHRDLCLGDQTSARHAFPESVEAGDLRVCRHLVVMDECCAVCAEPIQFTGYGPCGHKEACSKCVVRLRVVLNDLRCVICQQEHESVFITKFMGEYTQTLPAAAFAELPVSAISCLMSTKCVNCTSAVTFSMNDAGQGASEGATSFARC